MEFFILAKLNFYLQIIEKIAYGAIALYGVAVTKRYITDYKDSVEEEKIIEQINSKGSGN